jgi:hypothetical protein
MQNHPQIAELYKRYLSETQPFRKIHRLIDLFESIIKTHTVLIVSEYVQHNKLSEAAKGLLAQGLRKPLLETWQLCREVLEEAAFVNRFKLIVFAIIDGHNSWLEHNPEGNILPFGRAFESL